MRRILVSIMSILAITTIMTGCKKGEGIENYKTVIVANVEYNNDKWEIHKSYDKQMLYIVKNGVIEKRNKCKVKKKESEAISLPDISKKTSKNITDDKEYSKNTWRANMEDVARQIKWYEDLGYKIVLKARTNEFVEVYMKNDRGDYKRILAIQGHMTIVDVKKYKFKGIEEYVIEGER